MSDILDEARRWGAAAAAIGSALAAIGEAYESGFRIAREIEAEQARAKRILGGGDDLTAVLDRARVVSQQTALSYPAALRREVDLILNPPPAQWAGAFGQNDLAEVIRIQEGRQIVRDGMRDIRVWLGEVDR